MYPCTFAIFVLPGYHVFFFYSRHGATALTPYMMKYIDVVPILLKKLPFHSLMRVATEGPEHVHYVHMCYYYQHTPRGGGWKKADTILLLLEWMYRLLRSRIDKGPDTVKADFDRFVETCLEKSANVDNPSSSTLLHTTENQEMTLSDQDKPLDNHTFILAGNLGKHSMESVKEIVKNNGGRVLQGSLPPENLPVRYTVITTQREVDKVKVISSIKTAYRRGWDILSLEYVLAADKDKQTPNK